MIVAHRILIYPNNKTISMFLRSCGVSRFSWNWGLAEWERQYKTGEKPNGNVIRKKLVSLIDEQYPWMREVSYVCYERPIQELEQAYKRFFKKLGGPPKFKKKGCSRDSFYVHNRNIQVDGNHIKLSKIGTVRMRHPLRFQGKIMSARISRRVDQWFVSISVEIPDSPDRKHPSPESTTGVDLGVKAWATLADGRQIQMPDTSDVQKRLKRAQRQLSKMEKGSERSKKQIQKIAKLHRRISNVRENATHQLTADLVKRYSVVGLEDLNVKGMSASAKGDTEKPGKMVKQKAGLNRGILNGNFGELRRQLEYKAGRTGCRVTVINRFSPSSKTCSACGSYQEKMPLSVREWTCPDCGAHHDRDVNAARNIMALAVSNPDPVAKEKKRIGSLVNRKKKQSAS